MNRYVKRMLLKVAEKEGRNWIDEYLADPEKTMKTIDKEAPSAGFENLPTVSVQCGEAIFVEFLGEPEPKQTKDGKDIAYAKVKILAATPNGWDSENKQQINLNENTIASINLKRHANLFRGATALAPLTGKKLMIANMKDKVKTKKGSACDYRFVAL